MVTDQRSAVRAVRGPSGLLRFVESVPASESEPEMTERKKERRGFSAMKPEKQREIAAKGGTAAHEKGTAYTWDHDAAVAAGRKGGLARSWKRRALKAVEDCAKVVAS